MRKWIITGMICAIAGTAFAANLDQGTRELRLAGQVDFETEDNTQIDLAIGYGWLVRDRLELGLVGEVSDNDRVTAWAAGLFADWYLTMEGPIVPYLGIQGTVSGSDITVEDESTDETALVGTARAGGLMFVTENLAVDLSAQYSYATEDIFPEEDEASDTDARILLGLRYFFDMPYPAGM